MKTQPQQLTPNGILHLVDQKESLNVTLQIINFKGELKQISPQQYVYSSFISDGGLKLRCYWDKALAERIVAAGDDFDNQIIRVFKYGATYKNILIYQYEVVCHYSEIIGNPILYTQVKKGLAVLENVVNKIEPHKIKSPKIDIEKSSTKTISKQQTKEQKNPEIKRAIVSPNQLQQIRDLYPALQNWRIYCRIIKLNYTQFVNKKNSNTKLLTLELVDKKGTIIKAAMFGDYAERQSKLLLVNETYIFSNGSLKVDTFNHDHKENVSQLIINFTSYSKVVPAEDNETIQKGYSDHFNLLELKSQPIGSFVNVIGIIKQIQNQVTVPAKPTNSKGTTLMKRTVVLCDPINKIEIDVVFWNQLTKIDVTNLYKWVCLRDFKLHEYQHALSLNSQYKSSLSVYDNPDLKKYDSEDIKHMVCESLSYRKIQDEKTCKTIKELERKKEDLQENSVLWSELRVYLYKIKDKAIKKWYSGCPECKKAINQGENECAGCQKPIPKPKTRFILPVQLCDFTGSIWTIAYDEFAEKIFSHKENFTADIAKGLDENEFSEICKNSNFQQFRLKIVTKFESNQEGKKSLKHNVVKLLPLDYKTEANYNLIQIAKMI